MNASLLIVVEICFASALPLDDLPLADGVFRPALVKFVGIDVWK